MLVLRFGSYPTPPNEQWQEHSAGVNMATSDLSAIAHRSREANPGIMRDNRNSGYAIEAWVGGAEGFLHRIHEDVKPVGATHEWWDYECDGGTTIYEVKSCAERIMNRSKGKGSRPGRWKIDMWAHEGIPVEKRGSMFYLLVVHVAGTPKRAYLCSWAKMNTILTKYARQKQYRSISSSYWGPRLFEIVRIRRG